LDRALHFGAELLGPKRTRFRFWAPSCKAVQLDVDGRTLPMHPAGDGWFEADVDCGAGARYRYLIDDGVAVPDPASRFQPDDVHGPSEVIDPAAYVWQQTDWRGRPWEETVLVEVHVGLLGGYRGVIERMTEYAALGITAIELMPLGDFSGKRNWGYDGVLPYAPDSAYGRPEDLKALVDAAHGHGLMVFLDVVYNHFGPDGNYLHAYAEDFFRDGVQTPWGPAIDFEREQVRDFFIDNALYWLGEYRFDGLRIDAAHAIGNDRWLRELATCVRAATPGERHVHLVLENEHNAASLLGAGDDPAAHTHYYDAQWNDDAHNALHVLLTGETDGYYLAYADRPIEKLTRVLAEGFAYQGEPSPIHDGKPRGEPSAHLPPSTFVMFAQNHDQVGNRAWGERLGALCDTRALLAATAMVLLAPQIPLLFFGEEFGSAQPFLFFTDYRGELADVVREGRRREFSKFRAFASDAERARIPDPNDPATFEASIPRYADSHDGDALHWRHYYLCALTVRSRLIVPRLAGTRSVGASVLADAALVARWRLGDGETLTVALNLGDAPVPFDARGGERTEGQLIFEWPERARDDIDAGDLPAYSCAAWLTGDFAPVLALSAAEARR
jgi:maltooligosyltrehalose trehalohydrolase